MKRVSFIAILCLAFLPLAAVAGDYSPVTAERLANPEPRNWLMQKGNYAGWMYSELDQINKDNVGDLVPIWSFATGVDSGHEGPAIINDGVMFVATPYNHVIALDAESGDLLWRYVHELPEDFSVLHNTNRGVALWGDKVYTSALDGTMNALDAETGELVWRTWVGDWKVGAYITSGPLAVQGKILIGPSGGEFGVRGFLEALDAETGERVWKTHSVPGPGEPGHETWAQEGRWADSWKHGGGSMWMPGNYDVETDTIYWGVGNGSPWFGDQRPGDNLHLASVLALDSVTGAIKGNYQYHWNDSWDWAAMNAPALIDFKRNGETIRGLVSPQRNGYMYWLTREKSGKIGYVHAEPYVHQDVFESLDPETGRPTYHEDKIPRTGRAARYCPSLWGGKDWPYEAYDPRTGMMYVPANDHHCMTLEGKIQELIPGQLWLGTDIPDIGFHVDKHAASFGQIQAWNVNTGEKVWTHHFATSMNWGSVLATAGDVLFAGGTNDRYFRAFDPNNGDIIWKFKTNSGIISPPSSFAVDGRQYIAVISGWGVDALIQNELVADQVGWATKDRDVPTGGTIWVFGLKD